MPTAKKKSSTESLALRIIVLDPPPNILWALQLGQDEMVKPSSATKRRISFDFAVEVVDGTANGVFRLRGPAVQGRPDERFVYLRIGTYAGQTGLATHRSAEPDTLVTRVNLEERELLLDEAPETYYMTDYYRRHPVVLVRLSRIDRDALRDLLSVSWRLTSAKVQRSGCSRHRSEPAIDGRAGRDD